MVVNKETYRDARIEVVFTDPSDVIATSTLSNDFAPNYDSGGWV